MRALRRAMLAGAAASTRCCRCRWPRAPTCCRRSFRRRAASATTVRARRTCTACSSTNASPTGPASTCSTRSAVSANRSGLQQTEVRWDLPVPDDARDWARAQWPDDGTPTLLISPCSSHVLRNWRADRYAAVADHAAARGWRIVLCGGRSELERSTDRRDPRGDAGARARPGRQGHAQAAAGAAGARRPGA